MNFVIVGLGSMGKRRLRLLSKMYDGSYFFCVDKREDRKEEVTQKYQNISECYSSIDEIKETNIDAAFVCTSPITHNKVINACLSRGWDVFSEINLVDDGYKENIELARDNGLLLYLSSTPLFRNEIKYIIGRVEGSDEKLSYCYHVGQYLPDWHPWENYKDFFIGNRQTNGCREILAIELPWMVKAFGEITNISSCSMRQTELDIDYNDNYIVTVTHKNGHKGVLIVDVVCRKAVRSLEVFGEHIYLTWDGSFNGVLDYDYTTKTNKEIKLYDEVDHQEGYDALIIENMYQMELEDFFASLKKQKNPEYSFEQDKVILDWINKIEMK